LEAAEKQIAAQQELQEVNEQLLAELEKRDQAVEEAVGIIVNLEDKVDRLMQGRDVVWTSDAQYESGYFRESHGQSSSPPTSNEKPARLRLDARKTVARMPSFLSEQSEGTEALRSLYLPHSRSYSDGTLPKLLEEARTDVPDSPQLSVLSESSFLSVYGDKGLSPGSGEAEEEAELPVRRHRKSSSVEKWIDERPAPTATPLKPARVDGIRKNGFLSLNDVLESPLQRLEKLKHTLEKHNTSLVATRIHDQSRAEEKRKSRELLRRGFTDKASFEHYQTLPPTPDTISTSTLRHHQNSNDTLGQQADVNERTFLSSIPTFQVPNPSHNAYQSTLSMRPRSAGETVTSRREGHGWDTETQEDLTETGSLSSTASASAYSVHPQQQKHIMPPNLFTFSNLDDEDDPREWGRDMMFNNDSATRLPAHTARRYDQLRRSSMVENPRSDNTIAAQNPKVPYNGEQSPTPFGLSPIDTSPRPNLPDRRSSLSATVRLRKTNPPNTTASSPITKENPAGVKKSRLAMPRLFTRSETTPTANSFQQQYSKGNGGRSQSYFEGAPGAAYEEEDLARATPPPIKRNRGPAIPAYRPSSAGEGAARARRGSSFGYDGAVDEDENTKRRSVDLGIGGNNGVEDANSVGGRTVGGRKWLGFGRTGSLRRT
jgi:hypothetical protein